MERKILIKNENYNSIEGSKYINFDENYPKILFTGKMKTEKELREKVDLKVFTDDLKIEKFETDDFDIHLHPFTEGKIPLVEINDVKCPNIFLRSEEMLNLKGENIEGNLGVFGEIKLVNLTDFEQLRITYENRHLRKTDYLVAKNGKSLEINGLRYSGKSAVFGGIDLENIDEVDLWDIKIKRVKTFLARDIRKIILNFETLLNLPKETSIYAKNFVFNCNNEEQLKTLIKALKEGKIVCQKIIFGEGWEDENNGLEPQKLIEKNYSLIDLLKIGNIEARRVLLNYLGGIKELVEKEPERTLVDKTEKGELWAIGDPKNPERCIKFLKYKDTSTDRVYVSFVPSDIESVIDGFAWKFNVSPEEYKEIEIES
jgi:hypothetical protein